MGAASLCRAALRRMGYGNAYTCAPSARVCAEPIVLSGRGWKRSARLADGGERGVERVCVVVCCDGAADADATCRAVARDLARASWDGDGAGWCRMVAVSCGAPEYQGRDGSGRWLWGFSMDCTVVRDFGRQG